MGLFSKIFGNKGAQEAEVQQYFKAFTAYSPVFTTYEGGLYEMELTRAVIHSIARACSKLRPEMEGAAYANLTNTLQFRPNPFMNTSQFLYRIATMFLINNNAFIVPIEDDYGAITGYYPLLPMNCEVMDVDGVAYLRYSFNSGERAAIEFSRVGVLTQFQFKDDFFGSDNSALKPTMQAIHAQNQGIINGVKNSAVIRFLARLANAIKPEDIKKMRESFTAENLSGENESGMILYDAKIADIKPIESKPFLVNPAQMKQITENVYGYFGMNEAILQNKFDEDQWNAFYQGAVEPFAIQLSLAMSNMTFTDRELAFDNKITFAMNHLQYSSNSTRLQMSTQLFDRGLMNRNMVMDLWNLPHVEGGNKFYIRKEYSQIDKLHEPDPETVPAADAELLADVARAIAKHRKRKLNAGGEADVST